MKNRVPTQASATGSSEVSRGQKRRENLAPGAQMQSAKPAPDATRSDTRKAEAKNVPDAKAKTESIVKPPEPAKAKLKTKNPTPIKDAEYGSRPYFTRRLASLELERASWIQHWRECAEYILPWSQRFWLYSRNKGIKKHEKVINPAGSIAVRTLSSGMHSGLTSPARPWFRLTTSDPEYAEIGGVREWLHTVEERMRLVFARSNIYNVLPEMYKHLATFGTGCLWLEEDPRSVIRGFVFPIGSYSLGQGEGQKIDSVYRRVNMTVGGMVDQFGFENCSPRVQDMYNHGNLDAWQIICHACEPNRGYNPSSALAEHKKYISVWFELESGGDPKQFLKVAGYDEFPAMTPRWNVNGEDIYGHCPGMDALADIRALQHLERCKAEVVDKIVKPPLASPAALRGQRISLLPGDVTYMDEATPAGSRLEPLIVVPPSAVQIVEESIQRHVQRINDTMFASLIMMISQDQRSTPATAEEIRAKNDEKMLQFGPVLERLEDELLDEIIDRTFAIMVRRGDIPPPPKELVELAKKGEDQLRVEYVSILAQAQKLVGIAAVDRQVAFVAQLAQLRPEVLDLLDVDKIVREYQAMLGTNPDTMLSEDQVQAIRQQRAQQMQQQAQMEAMQQQAAVADTAGSAAKSLSQAQVGNNERNALNVLLGALGPGAVAGGGEPNGGVGEG